MRKLVVKIADKSGERLERVILKSRGLAIGRAWDSDIIIQDKFVDPDHLSLSLGDGDALQITDLNSTNGSSVAGRMLNANSVSYRLGDKIRVGDTTLQIFDQAVGVEVTAIRSNWFLLSDRFKTWPAFLALTAVAALVHFLSSWMFAVKPVNFNEAMSILLQMLIVLAAWSLILGFTSKLIRGESNIRAFWILGCIALILLEIVNFTLMLVRFNLQHNQFGDWLSLTVFCVLGVVVMVGVLTYSTHLRKRTQWVSASLVVVAVLLLTKSDDLLKQDHERWSAQSDTEATTLPPAMLWRRPVTLDEFQAKTDSLFEFDIEPLERSELK
ncbi:FHA domain-containing protein [Arenicella xantha]|uniref:Type III secretion system (T3SS) inner membrane Yop/YscD-like protein n=1 Tax=Arenicella xantha TaxID=644221 RepID=A0A395JND2_9GAMM|nr:FHA domain-containing protein [Arenicella xantha]RBP52803.1 type III secretion system (T3SS) inner membrane Yop/YscD-like protein [Arenicella xantha]